MSFRQSKPVVYVLLVAGLSLSGVALAQGAANNQHLRFTQEHGYTFSTIGDVGNAPAIVPNWLTTPQNPGPTRPVASVDYEYRISTTEVTWGQYFEFVQAYAPVLPTNFRLAIGTPDELVPHLAPPLPSPIQFAGAPGGVARFTLDQSRADQPATSSWHFFARMVNWLHNGAKPASEVTSADFETGVYDTSTFGRVANGPKGVSYSTDQDSRSPGSRFWIPSMDELLKATYYDPNRHGEDEGGYWLYGHSSDQTPIPGDPALGGETNGGTPNQWPDGQHRPLDVGSYPDVQSPWGLLDTVGGGREWTETWREGELEFRHNLRLLVPSQAFFALSTSELGRYGFASPTSGMQTLRLAAAIPGPGTGAAGVGFLIFSWSARRRRTRRSF